MPRAPRIDFPNALYHVISRGNGREDIFWTDDDRLRFLRQLADGLQTAGILLYAYVLMDNHFHLLVRTPRANLSRFMQRLGTSYALYCRYKHRKPGHQLEGRFKAKLVEDETYLSGSDPLYPPQSHQDGRLLGVWRRPSGFAAWKPGRGAATPATSVRNTRPISFATIS